MSASLYLGFLKLSLSHIELSPSIATSNKLSRVYFEIVDGFNSDKISIKRSSGWQPLSNPYFNESMEIRCKMDWSIRYGFYDKTYGVYDITLWYLVQVLCVYFYSFGCPINLWK